jgi:hypothetical protein
VGPQPAGQRGDPADQLTDLSGAHPGGGAYVSAYRHGVVQQGLPDLGHGQLHEPLVPQRAAAQQAGGSSRLSSGDSVPVDNCNRADSSLTVRLGCSQSTVVLRTRSVEAPGGTRA